MGTFARLREWLYRPVKGATPPGPDDLVEVCRFSGFDGRQRADLAVFELGANGIKAMAQHNDAHGNAPYHAFVDGHRVLVFGRDLEVAAAVLRED